MSLNAPRTSESASQRPQGVLSSLRAMPAAIKTAIAAASAAVAASIAGCADYGTPHGTPGATNNYYYVPGDGQGNMDGATLNANGTSTPNVGTDAGSSSTGMDNGNSGSTDTGSSATPYDAGSTGTGSTPETTGGSGTGINGQNCADLIAQAKAQGKDNCTVHTSAGDVKGNLYCVPTQQPDGSTKLEVGCKS